MANRGKQRASSSNQIYLPEPRSENLDWSEAVPFRRHRVAGDGHCFFRALTCALSNFEDCAKERGKVIPRVKVTSSGDPYKNHMGYRVDAIDAVSECDTINAQEKEAVLNRLISGVTATARRSYDRWAEDLEMGPLATRLGIRLFIYEPGSIGTELVWGKYGPSDGREVYLYNPDIVHFDALERLDEAPSSQAASSSSSLPPPAPKQKLKKPGAGPPPKRSKKGGGEYEEYLNEIEARKQRMIEKLDELDASIAELEDVSRQIRANGDASDLHEEIATHLDAAGRERTRLAEAYTLLLEEEKNAFLSLRRAEGELLCRNEQTLRDIAREMIAYST